MNKIPTTKKKTPAKKSVAATRGVKKLEDRVPQTSVDIEPVKTADTELQASAPEEEPEEAEEKSKKTERYFEAIGRRKTARARVRLYTKVGDFMVNGRTYNSYFPTPELQKIVEDALQKMKLFGKFKILIKTSGGGMHAQAEAVRLGLARCLINFNPDFRKRLKRAGFLKRDPRMKERKKFGLKKARRAPQWAKR